MTTRIQGNDGSMRKQPRQKRSHATTTAIVEAATRILHSRGWDGFNTNHIAETAGVSVGSLYQYFPNKEAIAGSILQRHFEKMLGSLSAVEKKQGSPEAVAGVFVHNIIDSHSEEPAIHEHLLRRMGGDHIHARTFRARYEGVVGSLVEQFGLEGQRARIACGIISSSVAGAVHQAAAGGYIRDQAFEEELFRLVLTICA